MGRPALNLIRHVGQDNGATRIAVGDVVGAGENRYPCYQVIAVSGERAWVRDVQYGTDHIVPIDVYHRIPKPAEAGRPYLSNMPGRRIAKP